MGSQRFLISIFWSEGCLFTGIKDSVHVEAGKSGSTKVRDPLAVLHALPRRTVGYGPQTLDSAALDQLLRGARLSYSSSMAV